MDFSVINSGQGSPDEYVIGEDITKVSLKLRNKVYQYILPRDLNKLFRMFDSFGSGFL